MALPIQIILIRQLAGYLSVPLFLVDPKGDLLFYNEPAEAILGRRFEITTVVGGAPPAAAPATTAAAPEPARPAYEGLAPGDEIEPVDPDEPAPERVVGGEDAALALLKDQLGGSVVGTVEP